MKMALLSNVVELDELFFRLHHRFLKGSKIFLVVYERAFIMFSFQVRNKVGCGGLHTGYFYGIGRHNLHVPTLQYSVQSSY